MSRFGVADEFGMDRCATANAIASSRPAFQSVAAGRRRNTHFLSIDVDDWPVAVLGPHADLTEHVVGNTRRMLRLLEEFGVRGTFFVLGRVGEAFPGLVTEIADAGHEIASHGYSHQLVTRQSPSQFRADVERSLDVLTRITGVRPIGYRAPAFSIVEGTRWAGPILADLGIRYSSSVFPFRGRRYGIADSARFVHRWPECELIEVPLSTVVIGGRRWPVGGGGYFRLMPWAATESALRRIESVGRAAVLYFHPYELGVGEIGKLRREGWRIPVQVALMQSLFRSRVEPRLRRLLATFAVSPIGDAFGGE